METVQNPARRLLTRIQARQAILFLGACTPLHAGILRKLGHHDLWVSSFELSTLLGKRDDESIGLEEYSFFVKRITACCPQANLFIDVDTGWSDQADVLARTFLELGPHAAMLCVQNLPVGRKDNSFLCGRNGEVVPPRVIAKRLALIKEASPETLLALRIENNILGHSIDSILEYLERLHDIGAVFDHLVFHHRTSDLSRLRTFSERYYDTFPDAPQLIAVATAYACTPGLCDVLNDWGYNIVVMPNYAIRSMHSNLTYLYQMLVEERFDEVEQRVSSMNEIFRLTPI